MVRGGRALWGAVLRSMLDGKMLGEVSELRCFLDWLSWLCVCMCLCVQERGGAGSGD